MSEPRATALELLDRPDCDPALATASYRFMELVNRYFGGVRTVLRFLASESARFHGRTPLRLLDIGSGSCDIPLAVTRWARRRGILVHVTCLETSDHAVDIARSRIARSGETTVQVLREDAFAHTPEEDYDYALASMCLHHFSDADILRLLERLRAYVREAFLINDLRRSGLSRLATRFLLVGRPAGVRHDALLSIRRGFEVEELRNLLAECSDGEVAVRPVRWFRIAAAIRFGSGDAS